MVRRLFSSLVVTFFLLHFSELFAFSVHPSDSVSATSRNNNKTSKASAKRSFTWPGVIETRTNAIIPAFFTGAYAKAPSSDDLAIREKIEATHEKVIAENRFIEFLDQNALIEFPVGLKTDIGVLTYTILIDSIVMTPRESFLFASMVFEIPQSGRKIHFRGTDIRFSKSGGLSGDGKLMLVGDYPVDLPGNKSQLIIKGTENKTYAEFDCRGFKQLSLDASLLFSRDILEPEDNAGNVAADGNVAVNFTTSVVDWNDMLINVDVPPFRVKHLKEVTFRISDAVLDFSDTRNAPGVRFPNGYAAHYPLVTDNDMRLWRGVYLRKLDIMLPPQLKNDSTEATSGRLTIGGSDVLLDHVGMSGNISASHLISLERGKIGNWNFSLERIFIDLMANEIANAGFSGKINIPINKQEKSGDSTTLLSYNAMIKRDGDYFFNVRNTRKMEFDLWKASVAIHPSSFVEIKVVEDEFFPKAVLNGEMTIDVGLADGGTPASDSSKNIKLPHLAFAGLQVQTVKPYVKVGSFSLGAEGFSAGMGGFPLQINKISGSGSGDHIALNVEATLALVGEGAGGFAAKGGFSITGASVEKEKNLSYKFDGINLHSFAINIDGGPLKFKGSLNFFKADPIYGNGISGVIDADFEPGIRVAASAIFGKKDGFRYWYADALTAFDNGITIFPSVAFYSFGGGAYYHMKMDDKRVGSALGETLSGIVYVPDVETGLGLKATMTLGLQPGQQAFNADLTFEMAFNKSGGLRYISLQGNGYFMTPPAALSSAAAKSSASKLARAVQETGGNLNETESAEATSLAIHGSPENAGSRAQLWAATIITYDFDSRTLHGNLKAYLNVAQGVLRGSGERGMCGEAVLHFAPDEWYIYIGRPEYDARFSLEVAGFAKMNAYFVAGSVVPNMPPLPSHVASIFQSGFNKPNDVDQFAGGKGIGFGANFQVDTGERTFLIFYGRFNAGLGFDMLLKDYGDAHCKGGGSLGINGWYASGQAYAFLQGRIGIKVKIFRRTRKIHILDIGAAVVAQAKLPNPVWFKGAAGGYFSVLGGMVKGNCSFEIELGTQCEIIRDEASPLEAIDVLAQLTPSDNSKEVDVFTTPQAVFNYEMDRVYEMVDEEDRVIKFKIALDEMLITRNGGIVDAGINWNDGKTVAALNPSEILAPESEFILTVKTSFKELKGGDWIVSTADGEKLVQTSSVKFVTGTAPDHLPKHNIAFSYPVINQFNLYKDEVSDGYIMLKQGQAYLFSVGKEWRQVIRFEAASQRVADVSFTYLESEKELKFKLPTVLVNERIYTLRVVNVPVTSSTQSKIDANVDTTRLLHMSTKGSEYEMIGREATGSLVELQEKEIYSSSFRVSKYNTVREKIVSINPSSGWREPVYPGVHRLGANIAGPEPFSYEEIYGSEFSPPLVYTVADLTEVGWYNEQVFPLIYAGYPLETKFTFRESFNRNVEILGVVPTKAVYLYQFPHNLSLTDEMISNESLTAPNVTGRMDYSVPIRMFHDLTDLANQIANTKIKLTKRMEMILETTFPRVRSGYYPVDIEYKLPGKNIITSTYRHKILNPN